MEMDGGLDQFKCKNSPLDLDLVLKLVLKHVGKADIDDLLECRLVNHSWNRAVVCELEQHGYALELDYKKMVKFGSLLWKSRMSRSKLTQSESGFSGLSFTDHHQLASLRLSLIIEVAEKDSDHANEMGEAAQLLMFHSQLRLAFVNFSYVSTFTGSAALLTNHELFNVLSLTSSTLTSIRMLIDDIDDLDESKAPSFEVLNFNESFGRLEFPKLTSLRYELIHNYRDNNDMVDTSRQVLYIIKKSPNLTNLDLKIWEGTGSADKSANFFQQLIEPCANNLEQLTLRFDPEDNDELDFIFNTISEIKFPKLTKLKLSTFEICESTQQFTQHLKTNCPALTHFQIIEVVIPYEPEELAKLQLEFPIFKKMTHFGFNTGYFMRAGEPEQMQCVHVHAIFNKMMSFYPELTAMCINLKVLLALGARLELAGQVIPQRDQYQAFQTISTLEVRISHFYDILDFMECATQIYHHTFPNIQQLIIKLPKTSFRDSPDKDKEQVAQAIALLCNHPKIRAIELHNYTFPGFEKMAEAPEAKVNLANYWQGVKSLKIFPPKCPKTGECPELNLLTGFPELEFLQYGKGMIYKTQIQTIRLSLNILKNPISKFKKIEK